MTAKKKLTAKQKREVVETEEVVEHNGVLVREVLADGSGRETVRPHDAEA